MKTSKGRYLIKTEYNRDDYKVFHIFDTRKWFYRLRGKTINLNPYVYGRPHCTEENALKRYKEIYEGVYYD
jgi:hypothetical protein